MSNGVCFEVYVSVKIISNVMCIGHVFPVVVASRHRPSITRLFISETSVVINDLVDCLLHSRRKFEMGRGLKSQN